MVKCRQECILQAKLLISHSMLPQKPFDRYIVFLSCLLLENVVITLFKILMPTIMATIKSISYYQCPFYLISYW